MASKAANDRGFCASIAQGLEKQRQILKQQYADEEEVEARFGT